MKILFSGEKISWSVKTPWHTGSCSFLFMSSWLGAVLTATMTATVTRTTKPVISLSSNTTILFTNIATEDARKTTIFSNRFMNFKIQHQKILSLLVLAIERQLKLKCRYHTWTPVVTLERVTLHLLTFWHFDTRNGFSVPGSGGGGSRGETGGGRTPPYF